MVGRNHGCAGGRRARKVGVCAVTDFSISEAAHPLPAGCNFSQKLTARDTSVVGP